MLKTASAEFQLNYVQLRFTNQNNRPLEMEKKCKYYTNNWLAVVKNEIFNRTKVQKTC